MNMKAAQNKETLDITPYLKLMVEKEASDIFFTVGSPVRLKVQGRLVTVGKLELSSAMLQAISRHIMSDTQRIVFEKSLELDFAYQLEDDGSRFRVNAFRQKGDISIVMRYVRSQIPDIDSLGLPPILKDLVGRKRGLLLMAGATNSGKSTTLAAMINHRNETLPSHIVTIEDPIEFVHPHKKSLINQRELGFDTHSYLKALRSCMRESPDVVLIGEIRDQETMSAALELCNTGHLAISTLHANNAYQSMQRIVSMYPFERHKQLFMDLSLNLVAIISQRLVFGVEEKRVAAVEVMLNTPHIADLILQGRIDELKEAMLNSSAEGMQSFDLALFQLYHSGRITLEEALSHADSRTNLEAKINFG